MPNTPKTLKPTAVAKVAFRQPVDLNQANPSQISGSKLAECVDLCVVRAISALEKGTAHYTKKQTDQLSDVFKSLKSTHRTIRRLLKEFTHDDPESVDALSLLRLQYEGLFIICLMLEGPGYVDLYTHDYWKKSYVDYLLVREERGTLPSEQDYLANALPNLINLRNYFGLTEAHQATVDVEELGTPLPGGMTAQKIERFPTPGKIPERITNPDKKRMLERLSFKYSQLCSFSHVLGKANLFKGIFDKRFVHRNDGRLHDHEVQDKYQSLVVTPANVESCLCVLQAATELTTLFPNEIELAEVVVRTWNLIADAGHLSRMIWTVRSAKVLRVIGPGKAND